MNEKYLPTFRRAAMRTSDRWPDKLYYLMPVLGALAGFTAVPTALVVSVFAIALFAFLGRLMNQSKMINDDGTMR